MNHHSPAALYPEIQPNRQGTLALDNIHTMYWEESGNPSGTPVVFLHGGPGAGSTPAHRRFFDPAYYRIVIYDQRGAGRSTPLGETQDNTTPHLINDLESLRQHLGIDRWLVFGGSWGSTLALAYGEAHPALLVIPGISAANRKSIGFVRTAQFVPEDGVNWLHRYPIRSATNFRLHQRLMNPDPAIHHACGTPGVPMKARARRYCPMTVRYFASDVALAGVSALLQHNIFLPENRYE